MVGLCLLGFEMRKRERDFSSFFLTENYKRYFRFLIFAKEFCDEEEMEKFDMHSVLITPTFEEIKGRKNLFEIKVPGIIDKYPSVSKGGWVMVFKGDQSYRMLVFKVAGVDVYLNGPSDEQEFIREVKPIFTN